MRTLVLALVICAAALAQDDSTAGSATPVDNYEHGPGNPEGAAKIMNEDKPPATEDEGLGKLLKPGGDQEAANVTTPVEKKPMACLCKGVDKLPEDNKVLSAGWKKRAKKCSTEKEEEGQQQEDPEKCSPVGKVRCVDKEESKKGAQCASKPKTKKQKEAKALEKESKQKAKAEKEEAAEMASKAKCLSKYCNDDDNLNRKKKNMVPVTSIQCYDKCNKNHCIKLFDQGWEHWYECVQTCVGSCFKFED